MRLAYFVLAALIVGCTALEVDQPQGALNPTNAPRLITAVIDCTEEKRVAAGCCSSSTAHTSQCCVQQDKCGNTVQVVSVTTTSSCTPALSDRCCKTPEDTCCNQKCYVEPEYTSACLKRTASTCCQSPQETCCNQCSQPLGSNARFAAEAVAIDPAQCTEEMKAKRCCFDEKTPCCSKPCGNSTVGAMVMGSLKLNNCTDLSCRKIEKAEMITHTDADCPAAQKSSTCCTAAVTSCCSACSGKTALIETLDAATALSEMEALLSSETEYGGALEYSGPFITDPTTGKKMYFAKIAGCDDAKRASKCCSTDTEHYTTCCQPKATCLTAPELSSTCTAVLRTSTCCTSASQSCCSKEACSNPVIGSMKMGTLQTCEQAKATVCCTSATDNCCKSC